MSTTFVYVTYIRTTPQKLWDALTKPEFIKQYWFNMTQQSEWKTGASWKMLFSDGRVWYCDCQREASLKTIGDSVGD